jgi:predicted solute-binding protein
VISNVGRIAYTNTEPFFQKWPIDRFPLTYGVPRALAGAARAGEIVAAPLPIVECWDLENTFSP